MHERLVEHRDARQHLHARHAPHEIDEAVLHEEPLALNEMELPIFQEVIVEEHAVRVGALRFPHARGVEDRRVPLISQ